MQITDHVFVFRIDADWFGNDRTWHPTAVETQRGLYLFDVGGPDYTDALEQGFASHGLNLDDVTKVFITHQDYDHLGGLPTVVDRIDPEIVAHRFAAPYVSGRTRRINRPEEPYPGVSVDIQLAGGERFRTDAGECKPLFTPGHSPGHLAFYFEDARLLIAGDLLRSDGDFLGGPKRSSTPDMAEARRSIGTLTDRSVEQVICYHGGPIEATEADIQRVYDELAGDV